MSTENVRRAGVGSATRCAASSAKTEKLWAPSSSESVWKGVAQGSAGASSTEQRKVAARKGAPASVASKEKVGLGSSIVAPSAGPAVIDVSRDAGTSAAGATGAAQSDPSIAIVAARPATHPSFPAPGVACVAGI